MRILTTILIAFGFSSTGFSKDATTKKSSRAVKVEIGDKGFVPSTIQAKKGEDINLLITRTTDSTCMKSLKRSDGDGKLTKLPLNKEVTFKVGKLDKAGEVKLLCGMDMGAGVISVQ